MFVLLYGRQSSKKIGWNTSPDNVQVKNCRNLILGEAVYLSIFYHIPDSWLFNELWWFLVLIAWIRSNNDSIKFVEKMRKKWNSTRSTLNLKLSSCRESLGKYLSLCSCNTSSSVYKNVSYRGHRATLCDDIVTNPWPPIHISDPTLTIKAPYDQVDLM